MKKFISPFVLATPAHISSARLESRAQLGAPVSIELDVANDTPEPGQATLTAPEDAFPVCAGPMRLRIATTCGCWSQTVQVPACEAPSATGSYDGDGGVKEPIPSCTGDEEPSPSCTGGEEP